MSKNQVVYVDKSMPALKEVEVVLGQYGYEFIDGQCKTVEDILALPKDVTILITEALPLGEKVIKAFPQLKLLVANCIGYDMININAATRHGIPVCNNPDYCIREVAEHTVAMLLCLARKIHYAHGRVCDGYYNYKDLTPLYRVENSIIGFVGFGRIARLTAKKISPMVGKIVFYDPYVEAETVKNTVKNAEKNSLEETLRVSDYICLHMPLTKETYNLINKERLEMMKPTACLINSARGEVVDTDALIKALENNQLRGAALDVVDDESSFSSRNPLCHMDNVVLTPHSAWYSQDSLKQVETDLVGELSRFIRNKPLKFLLNPEVIKTK